MHKLDSVASVKVDETVDEASGDVGSMLAELTKTLAEAQKQLDAISARVKKAWDWPDTK